MLITFGLLNSVQFQSDPCSYADIFPPSYTVPEIYVRRSQQIVSNICPRRPRTQCANKRGGGRFMQVAKHITQVYAQNNSGTQFIAPRQGPILGTSPVPSPVGYLGRKLCRSQGSTTLWHRLWSGRWPIHVHVKGIPLIGHPFNENFNAGADFFTVLTKF